MLNIPKDLIVRLVCVSFITTYAILHTTYIEHLHFLDDKELQTVLPYVHSYMIRNTNYSLFRPRYNETPLNFIEDPSYCLNSDRYKLIHPSVVLQDRHVLRELEKNNLQREIIKKLMFDAVQGIRVSQQPTIKFQYRLPEKLSYFYTFKHRLEDYYYFGKGKLKCIFKGLGCLFQKLNHMPGMQYFTSKNALIDRFIKYSNEMVAQNKSADCVDQAQFFPKTYRLNSQRECALFFTEIYHHFDNDFEQYDKTGPEWLLKTDVHRGEGVSLMFRQQMLNLTETYEYGRLCGKISTRQIAQRYVNNPYLYKNHKIEFRMYVYVASSDPVMVYVYKRPLIKRCASVFDQTSSEISAHICNTAIVEKQKELDQEQSDNEESYIDWSFEGLQDLLLQQKRIKDDKWLKNHFYPLIYRTIIHMFKSVESLLHRDTRYAEFVAIDFILDNDLRVWALEVNFNPQILSVTPDRIVRNYKMIDETMDIAFALIRSKYIRVRRLIDQTLRPWFRKHQKKNINYETFAHYQGEKVQEALRDRIDETYALKSTNLYEKIIDETFPGKHAYFGLLDEKCLIVN